MNRHLLRRIGLLGLSAALILAAGMVAAHSEAAAPTADRQGVLPARVACLAYAATNPYLQTKVVTSSDARVHASTTWATLACGSTTVSVPRGRRGLVVVNVNAEVTCTGPDGQWCLGRVLIGGAVGRPTAPEPDSFAWANSEPNGAQWESNAFTRTRALACPRSPTTTAPCVWAVVTQVRNHAAGLSFRVDDSTVLANVTFH